MELRLISVADSARALSAQVRSFSHTNCTSCVTFLSQFPIMLFVREHKKLARARTFIFHTKIVPADSGVNVRNISTFHAKIRSPNHSLVEERDADKSVLLFHKN